jgi:hypothetical protein
LFVVGTAVLGAFACATSNPSTQARLVFTLNAPLSCSALEKLTVAIGRAGDPEGAPAVTALACSDPSPATIGSLVVTEAAAPRFQLVARASFADSSGAGSFALVARRVVDFRVGAEVVVPVAFDVACAGVDCPDGATCVASGPGTAQCVGAEVVCTGTPSLCTTGASAPASDAGADAASPDAAADDGAPDSAHDAPTDGPHLDAGRADAPCSPYAGFSGPGEFHCGTTLVSVDTNTCCDADTHQPFPCSMPEGRTRWFGCDQNVDCTAAPATCCLMGGGTLWTAQCSIGCVSLARLCQLDSDCLPPQRCCASSLALELGICR